MRVRSEWRGQLGSIASSFAALSLVVASAGCAGGDSASSSGSFEPTTQGPSSGETEGDEDDDDAPHAGDEAAQIDQYVRSLSKLPVEPEDVIEEGVTAEQETGDYVCSTVSYLATQQFDELVAFAANSHTLFPGAWVAGDAVLDGNIAPLVFNRAPMTFSVALENAVTSKISATLEKPSLSSYREALKDILQTEFTGQVPANVASEIKEVHTAQQLSLQLGLDVSYLGQGLESSLQFDREEIRSRYLVQFTQTYYTVDIDPPGSPSDMLDPGVALAEVQSRIPQMAPAYVSSVSYGRTVYFAVTSEYSSSEMRKALEFAFSGWGSSVDGSVSLTEAEIMSRSNITAHILGGNGQAAVTAAINGLDELKTYLEQGGNYSPESPGAPIAYKLAYLADNTPARYSFTTDYETEECDRINQGIRVSLDHIEAVDVDDGGNNVEIFGTIDVVTDKTVANLMDRPESNAVSIFMGTTWPMEGEIDSKLVDVTPQPGHTIEIHVALQEDDSGWFSSDDALETRVFELRYSDGWRREVVLPLASGDNKLALHLDLEPI